MFVPNLNQNTVKYLIKSVGPVIEVCDYYKGDYFERTIICNEINNRTSKFLIKLTHKNKEEINKLEEGLVILLNKETKKWSFK